MYSLEQMTKQLQPGISKKKFNDQVTQNIEKCDQKIFYGSLIQLPSGINLFSLFS